MISLEAIALRRAAEQMQAKDWREGQGSEAHTKPGLKRDGPPCAKCGQPLAKNNKSGVCYPCARTPRGTRR